MKFYLCDRNDAPTGVENAGDTLEAVLLYFIGLGRHSVYELESASLSWLHPHSYKSLSEQGVTHVVRLESDYD